MLPSSLLNLGGKGVELSQGVDGRISLPGIALAAAALMYLGKKQVISLNKK